MKLDPSLLRLVLLEVERLDDGATDPFEVVIAGRSRQEVSYHVRALSEAGMVKAFDLPDGDPSGADLWMAWHLLWGGHQYLAAVRDETVWKRTLERVAKVGGSVTLEVMKATATAVLKQSLGLGAG